MGEITVTVSPLLPLEQPRVSCLMRVSIFTSAAAAAAAAELGREGKE